MINYLKKIYKYKRNQRFFLVHEPQGNRRIRVKILRKEIQKIMEFKKI